jgi:hypothetical protein
MANEKELKDLTQEELIEKCEKLEEELKWARETKDYYFGQNEKLKARLVAIENILKL